jgi:DNA polymerase-1
MGATLYLIDGHSQIYRAYYARMNPLTSPTGEPTRATYVFCQMLLRFIADRKPRFLGMAIDGPAERLRRRAVYGQYKITRRPMPPDLLPQVNRIYQVVQAMGIPILQAEGYEADDILATAAQRFASPEMTVVLISRDKDLDQLVNPHVLLYDPMKDQTFDAAAIEREKGYPPDKAVEVQALMGDNSDNVPGVTGVGPKTAADLIARYGTAEAVIAHAGELAEKLQQAVIRDADKVRLARRLVTLDRSVPIRLELPALEFHGLRRDAVLPIFIELGFNRLIEQFGQLDQPLLAAAPAGMQSAGPAPTAAPAAPAPPTPAVQAAATPPAAAMTTAADFDYRCIDTVEGLESLARQLSGVRRLAVDTESTSVQPTWADMVGLSLAWEGGKAFYVPVRGPLGSTLVDLPDLRRVIGPILADEGIGKVGQNLKFDWLILAGAGIELRGPMFDTMVAAWVLDPGRPTFKLDALAAEFLHQRCIPLEELIGRGRKQTTMDTVPVAQVTPYAAEDADVSLRLADVLESKLAEQGLSDLMTKLEMPLMPVLAEMEQAGIRVDPQILKRMETHLAKKADILRDRIIASAGEPFNPDSPRQLAQILFERLHLPEVKRTKTGPSTDSDVLEELAALHELPGLVLDYRKLTKLLGTYLTALAKCINPRTGRVHTSFHQTGTVTGRLSSSDPNLQNIPIRTEEGRQIRSAFVAPEGHVLLSADYSQVELRVLAHLCGDPTLTSAFLHDQDIHRIVAAEVFGVPAKDVTPEQRGKAKTVNFGIIYGQTAFGLAASLRIRRTEAGEFIKAYRRRFQRIDEFLRACVDKAKADGYVETIFGRRRRIVGLDSPDRSARAAAERLAINSTVQGSAADLIKQAMVNIAHRIRTERRPARMLLQIHDELLFELPPDAVPAEREMIVSEMSGAIRLCVPLKEDVGVGAGGMEAK